MSWTKKQIKQHQQAARLLDKIIKNTAEFIRNNSGTSEVAVREFIKKKYKEYNLVSDKQKSIVAFGENTSFVHFYADQPRRLRKNNLIMIDIWARLDQPGAPFADITWMLYYGQNIPLNYIKAFQAIAGARNKAIKYLKNNLKNKITPSGAQIDATVRQYLDKYQFRDKFLHGTGHSLGFTSPHGNKTRISKKGRQPLPVEVGYTIEPGVYFENKFGVRSEIDFYINKDFKLIITTAVQDKIIIIK